MPRFISAADAERVKHLRATGLSQAETARRVGLARETVRDIDSGAYDARREARELARLERQAEAPLGSLGICPDCGRLGVSPCVRCAAEAERLRRGPVHVADVLRELAELSPEIGVELVGGDLERYEAIHARKQEAGAAGQAPGTDAT